MAIIEKGTWTLNPTFSSEVNPPINISIKLDNYGSFSYVQEQQAVEVWTKYYLDQTIAAEHLNEISSSPKVYITSGIVPETQTISDSDLAILQTLGFSFDGEAPGWVEGLPYIKTESGWKEATAYIKTEDGWKYLSAFQKKA
jgi:hypothetical protein